MDAPQTDGDWTYLSGPTGGTAQFGLPGGEPRLLIRCDRPAGSVSLVRSGHAVAPLPVRVLTETTERVLDGYPSGTAPPTIEVRLAASDSLLDAMAFSKGRFALEVGGLETLYVPAWPEITRVIEDCR